jgi:thiol-disulfide isomerase/thioredoxin
VRGPVFLIVAALVAACAPAETQAPVQTQTQSQTQAGEAAHFAGCADLAKGGGRAELPEVTLPCFTGGEPVQVKGLRGPMVINFWASWCLPCGAELPAFQRLAEAGGVPVIGVATDDTRQAALSRAIDLGVTFPMLYDRAGELRRARGESALPLTLFVTATGEVSSYTGPALTDDTLAALVKQRLGGAA